MAETAAIETLRLEGVRKSYDIGTPVPEVTRSSPLKAGPDPLARRRWNVPVGAGNRRQLGSVAAVRRTAFQPLCCSPRPQRAPRGGG